MLEWYEKMVHNSDLHLSDADKSRIETSMWQAIHVNLQPVPAATTPTKIRTVTARTWFRVSAAATIAGLIATVVLLYRHQPITNQPLVAAPGQEGYEIGRAHV